MAPDFLGLPQTICEQIWNMAYFDGRVYHQMHTRRTFWDWLDVFYYDYLNNKRDVFLRRNKGQNSELKPNFISRCLFVSQGRGRPARRPRAQLQAHDEDSYVSSYTSHCATADVDQDERALSSFTSRDEHGAFLDEQEGAGGAEGGTELTDAALDALGR